ncbi:MAG: long-chain-fatty-acid--CoA ligase FadD2, partial [Acidimicrobiaceae bacterium]|nr:long-chain-fatty-acid--CoA ligase FadD2 [Acidimicrobiaceae bacterium]
VLCRNHRGFLTAVVALAKLGADTVYLNTGFAAPELAEVVARESVAALIIDEEFLPLIQEAETASHVPVVVAWVDDPSKLGDHQSFDRILAESRRPAPPTPKRPGRQIILTSGTTGTPKGAQRKSGSEIGALLPVLSRIPLRGGDVTLVPAPMFHAWGLVHAALGLVLGATLVLPRRFDPEDTLRLIEAHKVRVLVAVPIMLQRIMQLPDEARRRYDTSSLQIVALSGSAIPGDLAERFMNEFGDVIYNLYGSTEVGWASVATPEDMRAARGTAGKVPVGTRIRILDEDDQDVAPGETGRIFVRSGLTFDGYTGGGGKATVDGYLSSGDMGHFDPAGRLFIDGRDDDMIVSGGENVFPAEVDDVLAKHPDVADVAVIGVPDEMFGQRLRAFVVLRSGSTVTPDDLKEHVRTQLARFKVPRDVILVDEIPRNAAGKVVRRLVQAM